MLISDSSPTSQQPEIIAASAAMQHILELARRAATSNASVLIQGETGTGKELIARTIHQHSSRASKAFVAVNCGAYTDSLLASELFGHIRGAFTGAVADRAGVFEAAAGGTVFLDEVSEMSPTMQVKMLRVLQERKIVRVGSSHETSIDVRVIAATNDDLAGKIRTKEFREDLYYRVKVISCVLPPLRDRREDIGPLIDHYLTYFCKALGDRRVSIAEPARRILMNSSWPGNVRQLRGEVEQLVSMAADNAILGVDDLSFEIRNMPTNTANQAPQSTAQAILPTPVSTEATYQQLLDAWTKQVVQERLDACAGNITKTAQSLAISRSTLYALLKKYGMHGQDD